MRERTDHSPVEHGDYRRRYSVRCEIHQLHYNPAISSGCVLCKRQAPVQSRGGRLIPGTLLFLGILLFLGFAATNWRHLESESRPPEQSATATGLGPEMTISDADVRFRIDPENYRPWLVAIETKLYQKLPPTRDDVAELVTSAQKLAVTMKSNQSRAAMGQITMRIMAWAMALDSESDVGYSLPDFSRAREDWERLREKTFLPAAWFQQSDAEVVAAQTRPEPVADPVVVRQLRRLGEDIHHLIAVGIPESRSLGEVVSDNGRDPEVRATHRKWRGWSRTWRSRVQKVSSRMPQHPGFDVPTELVMAYQELGSALHNLSIVIVPANDYGVPFLYQRQSRFEAARNDLKEAEEYLSLLRPRK